MTPLLLGCLFSDRIEALLDGRATIPGAALTVQCREAQALFREVLQEQAYDIAELSMGSHIASVGSGRRDYLGLPIFPSRSFRHGNLYVRRDSGIERPEDLAGRRVGLADFQQTAALWLRGLLADEHGVERGAIEWITAGLNAPVLTDRSNMSLPEGLSVRRSSETLNDLLERGGIDAVISPTAPRSFRTDDGPVRRLWDDPWAEEASWFRKTGVFPIMHVVVVRRSLVDRHPELRDGIIGAFRLALDLALKDLRGRDFPKVAMPWLFYCAADVAAETGDIWTYGLEANRAVLERMIRYARADGLIDADLSPDDLFS